MAKAKNNKATRTVQSKEQIKETLLAKQKQAKTQRFIQMFEEFKVAAIEETGLMVAAQVGFDPQRGIFPHLVPIEVPKMDAEGMKQLKEKLEKNAAEK